MQLLLKFTQPVTVNTGKTVNQIFQTISTVLNEVFQKITIATKLCFNRFF